MPRTLLLPVVLFVASVATPAAAQAPPPPASRPAPAPPRRVAVQPMTLSSTAWPDGGAIPVAHSQAGGETSPPLAWSEPPEGVRSFVLLVHDVDAAIGDGTDDVLHWLVWNIPGDARVLPAAIAAGDTIATVGGARQISATGPGYRGPGAAAAGPSHHYLFELYALDTLLDVPAGGASPLQTRAAVVEAMRGHVRGKGVYTGVFKRGR